ESGPRVALGNSPYPPTPGPESAAVSSRWHGRYDRHTGRAGRRATQPVPRIVLRPSVDRRSIALEASMRHTTQNAVGRRALIKGTAMLALSAAPRAHAQAPTPEAVTRLAGGAVWPPGAGYL